MTVTWKPESRGVWATGAFRPLRSLGLAVLCVAALAGTLSGQAQAPPPEAGGPSGDMGPYAIPRGQSKQPVYSAPPSSTPERDTEGPEYAISVEVPLVTLHVQVRTRDGQFVPGLKKDQFLVLEDDVKQSIQSFGPSQGGYTAVLLVEFAATPAFQLSRRQFLYDALRASYAFTDQMQKDDFVAVIAYDVRPSILVDFTHDKEEVLGALNSLRIPAFSEINLFDALFDTLDRLERVDGRKEIIVIGSGLDTFSKVDYDKLLKKIQISRNVTIYTISTGFLWRQFLESQPSTGASMMTMDYLQADNQMATFAKLTGGQWFSPRFQGELPEDFSAIAASVRNQYTLSYRPTNPGQDGSYRKLKVKLVDPGTQKPLIVRNSRGDEIKYKVLTREGYTARRQVE